MKAIPSHLSPPTWPRRGAFSLIEVTLALAIAALGFITLLGLLPQGLDMARRSANLACEARIVQKLSGELQSASWEDINWKGYGPKRFFNDQGMEIPQSELNDPQVAFSVSYVASIHVPASPLDLRLPSTDAGGGGGGRRGGGSSGDTSAQTYARRLGIAVVPTSNTGYNFDGSSMSAGNMHAVIVAKMNIE
jgi:uncharacterized protein (TIGR02598 family)